MTSNLLTRSQAAESKNVSTRTLDRAIVSGALQVHKAGPRLIRISQASLDAWMAPVDNEAS